MSLIQSARLNGHDQYAYFKDVPTPLPMQPMINIEQLLPHKWMPELRKVTLAVLPAGKVEGGRPLSSMTSNLAGS